MHFYVYTYVFSYIFVYITSVFCSNNPDLHITETGVGNVSPCSIGLQFFVTVNNTSNFVDYSADFIPDKCCLVLGSELDCDVLDIVGNCEKTVPKGETVTLNIVAPVLNPFERYGYCTAYLDSRRLDKKRHVMRDGIRIPFDTRLRNRQLRSELPSGWKECSNIDEDPMNDCRPVDCETFYNGKKYFYNKVTKRCAEVPVCVGKSKNIPNVVYDAKTNTCINEDPITFDDLDYIKKLTHSNARVVKDIVIIKKLRDDVNETGVASTDDIESYFRSSKAQHKHVGKGREEKTYYEDKTGFINVIMCYIVKNRTSLSFIGVIILVQCGLICTMIYFLSKNCLCRKKPQVLENKFFNYRQDASVTTPLIGTTNIETETTCQFMSESSNIDRRIQCYKACQKDNAKVSMSDDILSKCLNRRNWDRKLTKSDAADLTKVKESKSDNSNTKYETHFVSTKNQNQKVNFENEKIKDDKRKRSVAKQGESKRSDRFREVDSEFASSEQEIKCHSYNTHSRLCTESKDNETSAVKLSEKEIKVHSYNYMDGLENEQTKGFKTLVYNSEMSKQKSEEKGQASAQASFSNDSIDDFLSERGVLFITGENISNYTFSNESVPKSTSSISSRTSKNNIVKNVMSYLKRNKHGPSSEPGVKKSKEMINLELIHMSRASMYSSSNNGAECLKNLRLKDSRTSL